MRRRRLTTALGVTAALAVSLAAFAAASTTTLKLGTTESSALGERVAASPQGRTLYELSPETIHHLLCRSAACLSFWPPLTAPSRSTKLELGGGLHGRLSLLRRSNGKLQVTLNGHPLYRYSADRGRGQANGEGIRSFGGAWHAVALPRPAPMSTTAPAPAPPPYTYPATTPAPAPEASPPPATTTATTPAPPPYGY
jgi:predicted lipoprotein with Yx(FWY)xxD motif